MKDSKARVRVNVSGKRGELLQEQHAMNRLREPHDDVEAISLLEVPEPRVWKWDFPGEPEKKLRQDASSRHRRDTANVKETLDPHVDPSADVRDIKTRIVGEEVRKAAAQQHAPSANGYRGVDGAATRVPSNGQPGRGSSAGRTFRAQPTRWGRRGFAARRPAARRRVRMHPAIWAVALLLALPLLVVAPGNHPPEPLPPGPAPLPSAEPKAAEEPAVSVYLSKTDTVEELPLEQYLVGVLAAEMPAEFQLEALKAQAIAARTYIVQRLASGDRSGVPDGKAVVTDTVSHQAYIARDELTKQWARLEAELAKLEQAVKETAGQVMTYQGQPITASFFSTSNGYTENSEDYWKNEIPYLRSVESPWDSAISPKYKTTVSMSRSEFIGKLGLADGAVPVSAGGEKASAFVKILSYTQGHRIERARVGGKTFSGREIREKLELKSSQFSLVMKDGEIEITTYGYGHGVGMSQYGAEGMAREGYEAKEILKHYYTNISFDETSNLLSSKK